ncbi:MAG TPA: hypothetical protein VFS05_16055 [Gemmatimonadaceae bacterium]|nr:hypothetical protein [Gemmatimonadaceae bacterium]
MSLVKMLAAAALLAGASPAAAQFTAAIPPQRPAKGSAAVAGADTVTARDTSTVVRLREMREWVDSAAVALNVNVPPAGDSTARDTTANAPAAPANAPAAETRVATGEVTRFRDGAPAPNTATPLPFVALVGATSLLVGAWMLRR